MAEIANQVYSNKEARQCTFDQSMKHWLVDVFKKQKY